MTGSGRKRTRERSKLSEVSVVKRDVEGDGVDQEEDELTPGRRDGLVKGKGKGKEKERMAMEVDEA